MKLVSKIFAAALFATPVLAADKADKGMEKNPDHAAAMNGEKKPMMTDARLAAKLHAINKDEMDDGDAAMKHGNSSAVKEYGRMLKDDHQKADDELKAAADKAGWKLDDKAVLAAEDKAEMDTAHMKMDQVKKLKGAEFDRAFGKQLADDHQMVIDMLNGCKAGVQSMELKMFVEKTIPALEKHRDAAKDIASGKTTASMHH